LNIIIFSKNRAAQLDLCLRSLREYWAEFTSYTPVVLYKADSDWYKQGYWMMDDEEYHKKVIYEQEIDFRAQLNRLMRTDKKYTVFFCDDCIAVKHWSLDSREFAQLKKCSWIQTLSLRLSPRLNYCYAYDRPMAAPAMPRGVFSWRNAPGDFGYPMSLDGHIFRTSDIRPLLEDLDYSNPNQLEGVLHGWAMTTKRARPQIICFSESKIFSNPINRVQTDSPNRCGSVEMCSAENLQNGFFAGKRLSLDPYRGMDVTAVHTEMALEWE